MIEIKVTSNNGVNAVSLSGHSGYSKHGSDIVCASVSTIYQTAIMALQVLSEQYPEFISYVQTDDKKEGN